MGMLALSAFATQYNIGGVREVMAMVDEKDGSYVVSVRFLPVGCFDKATNLKINRSKASDYALLALSKHLKVMEDKRLSVSGMTTSSFTVDIMACVAELRLLKTGVRTIAQSSANKTASANEEIAHPSVSSHDATPPTNDGFLGRRSDYIDTIKNLYSLIVQDIPDDSNQEDEFNLKVAAIEERSVEISSELKKELLNDRMLLSLEQKDIIGFLDRSQADLLDRLRRCVEGFDHHKVQ